MWQKKCSSFSWIEESVVQMFEGKQGIIRQLGLCLAEQLFCTENSRQFITHRDSDVRIGREWTLHFCS